MYVGSTGAAGKKARRGAPRSHPRPGARKRTGLAVLTGVLSLSLVAALLLARGRSGFPEEDLPSPASGPGSPVAAQRQLGPASPREEIIQAARRGNLSSLWRGGETRPLLDPEQFAGQRFNGLDVAEGYRLARATPAEVLDEVFCYCFCALYHGHRSLLSCFTDTHAAQCVVCLREVQLAHRLYRDGADVREIERAIDRKFAAA